ncbi:MAG: PHP domain-containing protein [Candidatus Heimdallarchaeota archaeon]|nr:PHP domain-containing protein [Candidatus Heimdallarchaeota archaeon]
MNVDLHCHSTNSDGTWSVTQILIEAERKGVKILAITDHDNFQGSVEANQLAPDYFSGKLIAGIEISTKIMNKSLHFLAYFPSFDLDPQCELLQNLEKIKNSRVWRMKEMIKKAKEIGFDITYEDVINEVTTGTDGSSQPADVISRPHLARVLVNKGYVKSFDEAFDRYLADGKTLHIARFTLDFEEWIKQVKDLRGIIIWAHPFEGYHDDFDEFVKYAEYVTGFPIAGIERIYNYKGKYKVSEDFIKRGNQYLDKIIAQKQFVITAGGDFHGNVGVLGELELPENKSNQFLNLLKLN